MWMVATDIIPWHQPEIINIEYHHQHERHHAEEQISKHVDIRRMVDKHHGGAKECQPPNNMY